MGCGKPSLLRQLSLLVVLIALTCFSGVALSGWLTRGVEGNAHAINNAGLMRMLSYQLLAKVPLGPGAAQPQAQMLQLLNQPALENALARADLDDQRRALQQQWQQRILPTLQQARQIAQARAEVVQFVGQVNQLVQALDQRTTQRLAQLSQLHLLLLILLLAELLLTLYWLRRRVLLPWRSLMQQAQRLSAQDFSQHSLVSGNDEMAQLSTALNQMAEAIAHALEQAQQQDYRQQVAVMEERATIARELHDSIAQSLSCLKMQLGCVQMQPGNRDPATRELLSQMRQELNRSWQQLRELLTTFRLQLAQPGLQPALVETCEEFSKRLGFRPVLNWQLNEPQIASAQALHLTQIVREALNNVVRHASASAVVISLRVVARLVILEVHDNGRGFIADSVAEQHYGLAIMHGRARALGGHFRLHTQPGRGTRIEVCFPLTDGPQHEQ